MGALAQQLGVFGFQHINHAGHGVDGIFPEDAAWPVRGLALAVSRHQRSPLWAVTVCSMVGSPAMARSPLGPALGEFASRPDCIPHPPDRQRAVRCASDAAHCGRLRTANEKTWRHYLWCRMRRAVQAAVFNDRLKLSVPAGTTSRCGAKIMRRCTLPAGARRTKIFTSGQHSLAANIEAGLTGAIDQQLGHAFLATDGWIVHKRGVDAGRATSSRSSWVAALMRFCGRSDWCSAGPDGAR